MGKRGTKPIPKAIKLARGTLRKGRDGDSDLPAVTTHPPAPESLGTAGQSRWNTFAPLLIQARIMKDSDWSALEQLCNAYDDESTANETIVKEGRVTVTSKGDLKHHPAVLQRQRARDEIRRYLVEFGMTPSSRSGVQVVEQKKAAALARTRA